MTLHLIGTWVYINSYTFGTRYCKTHQLFSLNNPALSLSPITIIVGGMHNFLGKYSHVGVPSFTLVTPYTYPNTPNAQNTPISYFPISVAPSLVSTHIYLGSLTFSLRPDEVASLWSSESLSLIILNNHFVSANRS